ncbi:hypothetical protein [Thermophilibacter mediterraneus]|uniref:hypothetical protein n=1 Tax=Thermophilibacter mediterraneus TaxID=1871031 RepID=UPI00320AE3BD
MRICVSHGTALHYWLRMPNLKSAGERPSRARSIPKRLPGAEEVGALGRGLGFYMPEGCERIDLLVSRQSGRHQAAGVSAHLCSARLPAGSFVPCVIFGHEVYMSSPELVFLQMAEELQLDQLAYVGFALCSTFRLDDLEAGGCVHREGSDVALTSVARIRAYLNQLPRGTRNRGLALRALDFVRDGARSPREAGIAVTLLLPLRRGGEGYESVAMNQETRIFDGIDSRGEARWVTRIPDILVEARGRKGEARKVGVDYDAASTHSDSLRVVSDTDRRNLAAAAGTFTHISLCTAQTTDYTTYRRELDRIRRALGRRPYPRVAKDSDSPSDQEILKRAESRRFELWNRMLGEETYEL